VILGGFVLVGLHRERWLLTKKRERKGKKKYKYIGSKEKRCSYFLLFVLPSNNTGSAIFLLFYPFISFSVIKHMK